MHIERRGIGGALGTLGVFVMVLATGCASGPPPRPLAERLSDLKGRKLTAVTYEVTPLKVTLKENAVGAAILAGFFPIVGGLAGQSWAESAGREVMTKAGLNDPSLALIDHVTEKTSDVLKPESVVRVAGVSPKGFTFRSLDGIRSVTGQGVVLEVATSYWRITWAGGEPTRYFVDYQGRARLLDAETKALVNESWCYFSSDADKTTAPTFEQLMAEDAARLRREMADGIAKCGDELIAELLPK